MLFLLAAGLTLIFGIMDFINLAHGSLYMIGAFLGAWIVGLTGSFLLGFAGAVAGTALFGMALESSLLRLRGSTAATTSRRCWRPSRSSSSSTTARGWSLATTCRCRRPRRWPARCGSSPAWTIRPIASSSSAPAWPSPRSSTCSSRAHARMGALVRAGAANREMAMAMGVDIKRLFTFVFGIGAGLCAVAGVLMGPLLAVQVGMGENILILAFVVIVIGGIGSIRGALVGALLVGLVADSLRAHGDAVDVPRVLSAAGCQRRRSGGRLGGDLRLHGEVAVLAIKPQGLFPARG